MHHKPLARTLHLLVALVFTLAAVQPPAVRAAGAPTFIVNSLIDAPAGGNLANGVCETAPGSGACTLRAAVTKANHFPGGGVTIIVPANALAYGITLLQTVPYTNEADGDFNLNAAMTIIGGGADGTVIQGNRLDRIFHIAAGVTVSISGLTLQTGYDASNGLGGGAIRNLGTLTLANSVLRTDQSQSLGGAVLNLGTATLNNVLIEDASAFGSGGGIFNTGTLTLQNSAVMSSYAIGGSGGGIRNEGTLLVTGSTIANNQALDFTGGGIHNNGTAQILNSTISNNSATQTGGGIYNAGTANIVFSTIAGNLSNSFGGGTANLGGGIYNVNQKIVNLRASLLVWNFAGSVGSECSGDTINSGDYNDIRFLPTPTQAGDCLVSGAVTHNLQGGDPQLEPLANNGGPQMGSGEAPLTRALRAGSPALHAIPLSLCLDPNGVLLTTDQRGQPRPTAGTCDMGAVEGSVSAGLFARNLIRNGSAEISAGSPNGSPSGVPYWTISQPQPGVSTYYGYWPNHLNFPTPAAPGPQERGYGFFSAWNSPNASAFQLIDVSGLAALIDTGQLHYRLAGYFGGSGTQDDLAGVTATFLDAQNSGISSPVVGQVRAAERANAAGLLYRETTGALPAGTRSIEVDLTFVAAVVSAHNSAAADNLSLVIFRPGGTLYLPAVTR